MRKGDRDVVKRRRREGCVQVVQLVLFSFFVCQPDNLWFYSLLVVWWHVWCVARKSVDVVFLCSFLVVECWMKALLLLLKITPEQCELFCSKCLSCWLHRTLHLSSYITPIRNQSNNENKHKRREAHNTTPSLFRRCCWCCCLFVAAIYYLLCYTPVWSMMMSVIVRRCCWTKLLQLLKTTRAVM